MVNQEYTYTKKFVIFICSVKTSVIRRPHSTAAVSLTFPVLEFAVSQVRCSPSRTTVRTRCAPTADKSQLSSNLTVYYVFCFFLLYIFTSTEIVSHLLTFFDFPEFIFQICGSYQFREAKQLFKNKNIVEVYRLSHDMVSIDS